jgi:hypothetical protein
MRQTLGEDVVHFDALYVQGVRRLQDELFNGDYFIQKIQSIQVVPRTI